MASKALEELSCHRGGGLSVCRHAEIKGLSLKGGAAEYRQSSAQAA